MPRFVPFNQTQPAQQPRFVPVRSQPQQQSIGAQDRPSTPGLGLGVNATSLLGTGARFAGLPDLGTVASGLSQALGSAQNFQQGRSTAGALGAVGAAGSGLRLGARFLPVSGDTAGYLNTGGNALGALGGLAGLGYGLATRQGDLTPAQAGSYLQGGLQGAQGVASLAGASGAAGALGSAAPMAAAASGTVEGLGNLFGSGEGQMYDPGVNKAMGAVQLVGAAAAPFTFGLSALAAPVISLIGGALGMYDPTHYNALRMRQTAVGQRALQEVAGGYAQAAQSGDPAQALTALGVGAGDVRGQARFPVRSALNPSIATQLGLSGGGDFTQMSQGDYQRMLDYFAQDPSKLTVTRGQEFGGPGADAGAIMGSGDVAYLDQQAAQDLQWQTGSAAHNLIKSQLLQLYPPGTSPKLDEVRQVLLLKQMTPEQLATLPADLQSKVKKADENFDPWGVANPLESFFASHTAREAREAETARQRRNAAEFEQRGLDYIRNIG